MAKSASERLIKFTAMLELDPQALAKANAQLKDLAKERATIGRRKDSDKKTAALDANEKLIQAAVLQITKLEEALALIQARNAAAELAATKKQNDANKETLKGKTDQIRAEQDIQREVEKTAAAKKKTHAADEKARKERENADAAELRRQTAQLRAREAQLAAQAREAARRAAVPHYTNTIRAANTLSGITSVASMTPEQLAKAKAIWSQYAATVKKADETLFNQINANLARHKKANQLRETIEKQHNKTLGDLKKLRIKAERDNDNELLRIIKNAEQQTKAQHKRQEQEEKRHQQELRRARGNNRGFLEIGAGATGRGMISGVAGMGGVNLYGLGIAGGAGALVKSSLNAYTEVFQLKNMLAGIITTFNTFKGENGRPLSGAQNFERSQGYSNILYGRLRKAAVDSPLTLAELGDMYQTSYPFLARQGVSAEQSIGITNTIGSLGKMMGLRLDSVKDEIRGIAEGRIRNAQTFQAAGFTGADMKKLSQLRGDDLVKFFDEKFAGYQASLKQFSGSFIAQWTAMIDSLQQSAALLGEKIAPTFSKFAKDVQTSLGNLAADGTLDRFAAQFGQVLTALSTGLQFILTSVGSVGSGLMGLLTNIGNTAGGLLSKISAGVGQQEFFANMNRGVQSIFQGVGVDAKWGEEVSQFLKTIKGEGLSPNQRSGAILAGLEQIKKQPNPSAFVSEYTTKIGQIQEVSRALDLIKYLETGEGIGKLPSTSELKKAGVDVSDVNAVRAARNATYGKRRVSAMAELMSIFPDFKPTGGEYSTQTNFGGNSVFLGMSATGILNGLGNPSTKEQLIKQYDLLKQGFKGNIGDYAQLQVALDYLAQKGYKKFPSGTTARPQGGIGPVKPDSGGLNTDKAFNKIYEDYQKLVGPTPISVPVVDKPKKPKGTSTAIPRDFSPQIKAVAAIESEMNAIRNRISMNPKRTEADIMRAIEDRRALANAQARYETAKAGLQQLQATPDNRQVVTTPNARGYVPIDKSKGKNAWAPAGVQGLENGKPDPNIVIVNGKPTTASISRVAKADANLPNQLQEAEIAASQDIADYIALLAKIREETRARAEEVMQALLELQLDGPLNSKDPTVRYNAEKALLNQRHKKVLGGGLAGAIYSATHLADVFRYKREAGALDRDYNTTMEEEALANSRWVASQNATYRGNKFRQAQALVGLRGLDLTGAMLDQKIEGFEGQIGKGGLGDTIAQLLLPALYEQKRALEEQKQALEDNTTALNRGYEEKIQRATDSIFNGFGQSGFAENYSNRFNRKMSAVDNMTKTEIGKVRAGLGIAGFGMSDDQIKYMMKSNGMRGFSHEQYLGEQYKDQAANGVQAAAAAILAGEDPITALASSFQDLTGGEAMKRLTSSLFSGGYRTGSRKDIWTGKTIPGKFNKGAFTKDLISGGGSFGAQYLVNQVLPSNSYANEGSQLGGLAASMGAFAGLGAWAGPVGILAGGLIGSLFGKKKAPDPAVEQHRKRLEELLETISNRLKPQEDFYRMFKGVYGSESRHFAGRGSVLGSRAALGAI